MAKYPKYFYPSPSPSPPPLPPSPPPCSTARRLALLKRLCAGVRCETTRKMVQRCKRLWWGAGEADGYDVKLGR